MTRARLDPAELAERARRATARARYVPPVEQDGALQPPYVELAGVAVFVYVDGEARLRVSVHYDQADVTAFPHWSEQVPVRVTGIPPEAIDERAGG